MTNSDRLRLFDQPSIIRIMIAFELAIVAGSLAGFVALFVEASKTNASPLYGIAGIVLVIVFFLSGGDSLFRIISKANFKARIIDYIAEGENIKANLNFSTCSATEHAQWVKQWTEKASEDIKRKKGKSEMGLFLDKGTIRFAENMLTDNSIQDFERRSYVVQIASARLVRLNDLLKRL